MKIELIPEEGRFYKVNMHCHTTISDGVMTPEEVKEKYRSLGYDAVCFTDHEVLVGHEDLCDENFVALHGYEVAIKKDIHAHTGSFMPVYHFNMIAESQSTRKMPRFYKDNLSFPGNSREWAGKCAVYDENDLIQQTVYDKEWISDYLCAVRDGGYLITYNHPQWSLQTYNDYVGLRGLHAVEVINGGCRNQNDCTSLPMQEMLRAGMDVLAVGGDDNHKRTECGFGWTMIQAKELSYDALIDGYRRGDCYATEGPELLGLSVENGEVVVKCSPVVRISLLTEGRKNIWIENQENPMQEARLPYLPEKFGRYFRLEVMDAKGKKAYSRAYRTDEIQS